MTPEFADAVDPIFVYVLGLVERVERGEELDARSEQERVCRRLEHADAAMGATDEWKLARYALVAWIDDLFTNLPWDGARWWVNNILEMREFGTSDRAIRFFDNAKEATQYRDRDALEVYYVCVILGFRGVYENPEENFGMIAQFNLPPRLEQWLAETADGIRLGRVPPVPPGPTLGPGAPPLDGYGWMSASFLVFGLTLVVLGVVAAWAFFGQS